MTLCYTNRIMQYPFRISLPQIRSMEAVAKQLNTCRYTLIQRVRLRRVIFFKEKHRSDSPPTDSMQQKYESLVFNDKISASELRFSIFFTDDTSLQCHSISTCAARFSSLGSAESCDMPTLLIIHAKPF